MACDCADKLRDHALDRERQAEKLEEYNGLPITLTMAEIVRLKRDETLKCVSLLNSWGLFFTSDKKK